ncbi:MAG: hypothetical protein JETT_0803 [Candidatus Jettenia ecosi]|uniref:Carboxypeptidase regulatory-like domain-containing protein n=1 Tax=Candidatus Jettenia ecosi TaxID=2494326 RepID=A0A533QDS7_9BACT|nr:MAG: hypothetical protein JETT_0803 [Candidatus Jettenia ecosi]
MSSVIMKGYLKFILCILGISVFLTGWCKISSSDEGMDTRDNISVQDSDEDEDEDEAEMAGKNCLTSGCHGAGGEERFYLGGTIYTNSKGRRARAGATIQVVNPDGVKLLLKSDKYGNFYTEKKVKPPFDIIVSYHGREVKKPFSAPHGSCNAGGCHVVGAAGRVFISSIDLDLTGTVSEAANALEISYNSDIKAIFDKKCISCHMPGGPQGDVPLTTYAEVTDPSLVAPGSSNGLLLNKVNPQTGSMWQYLGNLSEYKKIKRWIVKFHAQETSSTGQFIANAHISLLENNKVKYSTITDGEGKFVLKKVKAGEYILKVSKEGYKTSIQPYQMKQVNVSPLEITMTKQ